jgi:lactate permease
MYRQILDPVAHSLAWSSLAAVLPLAALFLMLGVLRVRAWIASLASLAVAIVIAVAVYRMPIGQAALAASEGAVFGFYPILWIVINAIWVYQMTVQTGHFDVLRRSFATVSDDHRVQAIIIAFSFGALLEALAGFGTPVAVTSVMLLALGFKPLKAAVLSLVANTAPVAFGAMATPIITLAKVSGLSTDVLGAMVGRQTPILAVFVPLALVAIADGRRGLRETWAAALLAGVIFGLGQYAASNFVSVPLADVIASLLSAAALVSFVRIRHRHAEATPAPVTAGDTRTPERTDDVAPRDSGVEVLRAYAPYAIVIAVFVICQISAVKKFLEKATFAVHWPGLHLYTPKGSPSTLPNFTFNLLTTPGTQMLVAGVLTIVALRLSLAGALKAYGATL